MPEQRTTRQELAVIKAAFEDVQFTQGLRDSVPRAMRAALTPERIARLTLGAIRTTPYLLECDRASLFAAVLESAQLGLEIGGPLGQAYLMPFKRKVALVCGYRGLITLALRSGRIANIEARPVYEGEEFSYEYGTTPRLRHIPRWVEGRDAERDLVATYAVAHIVVPALQRTRPQFLVVSRAELDAHRAAQKVRNNGKETTWRDHFVAMSVKTPIRWLFNQLPSAGSEDLARMIEREDRIERNDEIEADAIVETQAADNDLDAIVLEHAPSPSTETGEDTDL